MIRILMLLMLLWCLMAPAQVTPGSQADWHSYAVWLKDYGVKCDGATDDGPAFNAAVTSVIKRYSYSTGKPSANLIWPPGTCKVSTTLNLAGLTGSQQICVTAYGTALLGHTTGMPVVDFTGTNAGCWQGGRIIGDTKDTPAAGMRFGRACPATSGCTAGGAHIRDVVIHGSFVWAGVYNNQSEGSLFENVVTSNTYPNAAQLAAQPAAGDAHGWIIDGYSHYWSSVPTVLRGAVTPGTGSFVGAVFINIAGACSGVNPNKPCSAFWIGNTYGHSYTAGSYGTTTGPVGGPVIVLYNERGGVNFNLDLGNMHKELHQTGNYKWPVIQFAGTQPSVRYPGFSLADPSCCANASSLFGVSGSVKSVSLTGARISIANPNTYAGVFDTPGAYSISGYVFLGRPSSQWNLPANNFTGGCVDLAGAETCTAMLNMSNGPDPTASSLPSPSCKINNNAGAVKLWCNVSGALKSVTLN